MIAKTTDIVYLAAVEATAARKALTGKAGFEAAIEAEKAAISKWLAGRGNWLVSTRGPQKRLSTIKICGVEYRVARDGRLLPAKK